jgi:hypothetical protein
VGRVEHFFNADSLMLSTEMLPKTIGPPKSNMLMLLKSHAPPLILDFSSLTTQKYEK